MLFDLNDYVSLGLIGPMSATMSIGELSTSTWTDAFATYRATRDAFYKSVNEYVLSSIATAPLRRREAIYLAASKFENLKDEAAQKATRFWSAMLSQRDGINSQEDFASYYGEIANEGYTASYTVFTPEIYNQYIGVLGALMSALTGFMTIADDTSFQAY